MGYDSTMPFGVNNTVVYGPKISVVGNGSVCIGSKSRTSISGTSIGHQAGSDLSSGSQNNVMIGRAAGGACVNGSNNIAIGSFNYFPSDVSNCLVINNNNQSTRPIGGIYGTNLGLNTFSLGLNNNTPASPLDISGNFVRLRNSTTPTSSADTIGNVGDIAWDVNYVYVKTAVGGWKRSGLTAF
jgi:hypothetical protein